MAVQLDFMRTAAKGIAQGAGALIPGPPLIVSAVVNLRESVLQIPPCTAYLCCGATSNTIINYLGDSPWGERPLRYHPLGVT